MTVRSAMDNSSLDSGAIISHYRVIKKLGAGGMGEVYLASDTELDRMVAVKILPAALASDQATSTPLTIVLNWTDLK